MKIDGLKRHSFVVRYLTLFGGEGFSKLCAFGAFAYLARMLGHSGRNRAAVRILENLIEAHPECDEARALLSDYRGNEAPAPASSAQAERAETAESPAPR